MEEVQSLSAKIIDNKDGTITKVKYKKLGSDPNRWFDLYKEYRKNIPELVEVLDFQINDEGTSFIIMPQLNLKGDFFRVYKNSSEKEKNILAEKYYSLLNKLLLTSKCIRNENKEEYLFHRDLFIYNIHVDNNNDLQIIDPDSVMFIRKEIIISQISTNFSLLTSLLFEQ